MFCVRSAPCPAPNLHRAHPGRPPPSRPLPRPAPRPAGARPAPYALSFCLSAGSVGVQPAAELRHVQRHNHVLDVPGALFACALPPISSRSLACALLTYPRCPPPHAPRPALRAPPYICTPSDSRQGASAFNQPLSLDTSSVTTMYLMFYVRSAPCRASDLQSTGLRAACTAVTRHPSAPPHAPRPTPYALLSTLGRARRRSTSR